MPAIVVAVAAAAAGAAATAAAGSLLVGAGFVTAAGVLSTTGALLAAGVGAVVAAGVSYAGSAVLGLNRPKSTAPRAPTREAQDRRQLVRSSVEPRTIIYGVARVSGPLIYASSSGEDLRFLHVVVPLAGHPVERIGSIWINDIGIPVESVAPDGMVIAGPLAGKARIRRYLGDQTTADPDLVAESRDGWSAAHVGFGLAYLYVRLEYDQEVFPSGLQNISAEVLGKREIFEPRRGDTGWSENVAICILDYLRSRDGLACEDDEIDYPSFITAANICDELVQIDGAGTTQRRYTLGGAFSLDREPLSIVEDMLAACAGSLVYVAGRYRLHVGAYDAPTDSLTASDLAGAVELVTKPPARERFNSVRGTYIDPGRGWLATEFPPVVDNAAIAEDGEQIWQNIDLPVILDATRAQRLAQMALRRHREGLVVRVAVQYRGIRYCVWQTLSVTLDDFGWSGKVFRITAWTYDPGSGLVTLTLAEETPFSYAWTWEQANSLGPARDTALVDAFTIPAPAGLAFSEELYVTANGAGVRTRAILSWVRPPHPFTTGYDVQVREASATDWRTVVVNQGELRAVADDLADGLYMWRVRARSLVAAGAWAEIQARVGTLAQQPPADIAGLAVQSIGGFAFLRWERHPDLDVRVGGRIEFRHTPDTVSPTWVGSTGIGEAQPGDSTFAVLPLKPGTYLAKAVDAGGRYSVNAAIFGAAQATALPFANVNTITESPTFAGAKTGTLVASSTLRLDSGGNIDAVTDFDAITDIDRLGGVLAAGSYTFAGGLDLGSVRSVRLTALLRASVVNTFDLVDDRAGDVDDWLDWDGAAGGEADAWVEVRETQDDPGGTPTWSAWRRLDQSEFRARGFQFRAQLRSRDTAFNIHVTELSVTADEVA